MDRRLGKGEESRCPQTIRRKLLAHIDKKGSNAYVEAEKESSSLWSMIPHSLIDLDGAERV